MSDTVKFLLLYRRHELHMHWQLLQGKLWGPCAHSCKQCSTHSALKLTAGRCMHRHCKQVAGIEVVPIDENRVAMTICVQGSSTPWFGLTPVDALYAWRHVIMAHFSIGNKCEGAGIYTPPGCSYGGRSNAVSSLRQQRELVLQIAHVSALRRLQHLVALDACKQSPPRSDAHLKAAYR